MRVCKEIDEGKEDNLMSSSNLVVCLAPALIGGVEMGGMMSMSESFETCRIPGMVDMSGTVRGLEGGRKKGGNTVGGVLKVMIERYVHDHFHTLLWTGC